MKSSKSSSAKILAGQAKFKYLILILIFSLGLFWHNNFAKAVSDTFPQSDTPPTVEDFLPSPANTYYCSPSGNNTTGDGSIGSPWLDFRGATTGGAGTPVSAGDLLYLRSGTYPDTEISDSEYSRSVNLFQRDGTASNPIVISNYPGEVAQWDDLTSWSGTIMGDYVKLIGTKVGASYGIIVTGGLTFHEGDYVQISGVDFVKGTSNGGDLNPAMLSDPISGYNQNGVIISHNRFRDSAFIIGEAERMKCINIFVTQNLVIEYNIFQNNAELREDAACILFKETSTNTIVRYNTFVSCLSGFSFESQGSGITGLSIYGNLFYDVDSVFVITNRLGNSGDINIYNNVALETATAFYMYYNYDNQTWTEHGDFYNNVIDGPRFARGWPDNSADEKNIPDLFDYNLWYSADDRNTPASWIIPAGYDAHSVTSDSAVTYASETMTCTVANDYAGRGTGRYSDNIGGFTFSSDTTPPSAPSGLSVS